MRRKLKIKTGDIVKVIAGNQKGTQGKVLRVFSDKNRAIVEGVNVVKKHNKPNANNPKGGICLLYTSPSPRDRQKSRMPSSA